VLARIKLDDAALVLRPMIPGDERFIFSSWLRSYREGARSARDVSRSIYFIEHHRLVERLLGRGRALIAADAEDPTNILGYVVGERTGPVAIIHYAYVKAPFREIGIARLLTSALVNGSEGVLHSHSTVAAAKLVKRFNSVFNPYLSH
jgi:hypothetical protein